MILNYVWIGFFLIAFVLAIIKLIFFGDAEVFNQIVKSIFSNSKTGFEISLGLTGMLTLWMGLMRLGEKGGIINIFSKIIGPFFSRLFPELPKGHPAIGSIMMNFAANLFNLDNAATPLGLKAMQEMQATNPNKDTASNSMIMFLVINTSCLILMPISVMVYRAQLGALNPSDVFIPILVSTYFATTIGILSVALKQRINIFDRVILTYFGIITLIIVGVIYYFSGLPKEKITSISSLASNIILFSIVIGFISLAIYKKVNVYETFIEGAKDGFTTAVKIIPYLVAILVSIGVFRASGAMDIIVSGISSACSFFGLNTDFIPALPTALMKPLSGSGARGLMIDTMKQYGADSFAGRLASIFQGTTDTTFYIVAVYFGSVGVKKTRYAVTCGLIADFAGVMAAIIMAYLFFHY